MPASSRCKQCDAPLVEIDHYGERLTGCPKCNRWQASNGEWCRLAPDDTSSHCERLGSHGKKLKSEGCNLMRTHEARPWIRNAQQTARLYDRTWLVDLQRHAAIASESSTSTLYHVLIPDGGHSSRVQCNHAPAVRHPCAGRAAIGIRQRCRAGMRLRNPRDKNPTSGRNFLQTEP